MYSKQRRHDFLAFFTTKKEPVSRQAPKILTKTKLTTKKTNILIRLLHQRVESPQS